MKTKREKAEDQAICARAKELRELLAEFDVRLSGFDPGISGFLAPLDADGARPGGSYLQIAGAAVWKWLEPLLVELRGRRRGASEIRFTSMAKFDREIKQADLNRKREDRRRKKATLDELFRKKV